MAQPRGKKLIVLGLPWESTESTIDSHFSRYGDVESTEVIHNKLTGKSRGFGFVTFREPLAAEQALADSHTINGRRCDVKNAVPKGESIPPKTRRIFVARIPPTVTEDQFREYFEGFGMVEDAYMPRDHTRQSYRGIGFVTFVEASSTESVMAVKHRLDDHDVVVDRAMPKDSVGSSPRTKHSLSGQLPCQLSHNSNGRMSGLRTRRGSRSDLTLPGNGFGSGPLNGVHSHHMDLLQSLEVQRQYQDMGLSQRPTQSVMDMQESPGDITSASGLVLPPGIGHEDPQMGIQRQEGDLGSMPPALIDPLSQGLAIDVANRLRDLATGAMEATPGSMGIGTLANNLLSRSSLQLSPNSLIGLQNVMSGEMPSPGRRMDSAHVSSARGGPRLFVGKLSKDTTEQDLRDYFLKYGYVMDVYMPRSKDNKKEHRGFGFVTFETEAAVQRVVAYGAHKLRGAVIAIDVALPEEPPVVPLGVESRRSNSLSGGALAGMAVATSIPQEPEGGVGQRAMRSGHGFRPY
ncbi:unnamed protein product [Ostreobium quekettii]|uniref:RRM domain-containing protein n=1 Tax=Ostreobium quekettii TaxID=121088 RepID=A0A8S1IPY2_9CHLO|nr:unnamed protein product [Ostreobium quekettii]